MQSEKKIKKSNEVEIDPIRKQDITTKIAELTGAKKHYLCYKRSVQN